jgi:integrase
MAKAYLAAYDPTLAEHTWRDVIAQLCARGKPQTRSRQVRACQSKPFDLIRHKRLIETAPEDLLQVLRSCGVFNHSTLRSLHNLALGLGWLPWPILPSKLWPVPQTKQKRGITAAEHQRIIAAERNTERRMYYELLWETGASQTDAALLTAANIDWGSRILAYQRRKTGESALLRIGTRLERLLRQLPAEGYLFPTMTRLRDKDRAAEFRRRCRVVKIEGVSLHSYRYGFAERAQQLGVPERFAQAALGHASKTVHRAYAKKGIAICPSLEDYEGEGKIVPMKDDREQSSATALATSAVRT